jgi:ribosomal protein L37AE/L43A
MTAAARSGSEQPEGQSAGRQAIAYCPYCSEETLFPRESGGWECRSCLRAFSVTFLGLVTAANVPGGERA